MSYELYSLLGISPDSFPEEIKAPYSRLLREHYSKKYPSEDLYLLFFPKLVAE